MPEQRPPQVELVEAMLSVHRMAAGQAVVAFEVDRGDDLARDDGPGQARRVAVERPHDEVAERLAGVVPGRVAERVGRPLDDDAHHVRAGRGPLDQRRVGERRDGRLEHRLLRQAAELRGVVGALHRVDPGRDEDPATQDPRVVAGRA